MPAPLAHEQITEYLRDILKSASAGDRLPSDRELSERFGVSRMTARQAVSTLVKDGRAYRLVGRGTYVSSFPMVHRRASRLLSFAEHMSRQGREPSVKVLEFSARPGSPEECADLKQPMGRRVFALERLLCGDGVPIAVEAALLPESAGAAIDETVLAGGSLHDGLSRIGSIPMRSLGMVSAESASPHFARLLDIPVGGALVTHRQVMMDGRDHPIELVTSRYVGDRFVLDVDQYRIPEPELPRPGEGEDYNLKSLR